MTNAKLTTTRFGEDTIRRLKALAESNGSSTYQGLLRQFVIEGLRREEAALASERFAWVIEHLRASGVSGVVVAECESIFCGESEAVASGLKGNEENTK